MLGLFFGNDMLEVDKVLSWRRDVPDLADKPLDAVIEAMHSRGDGLAGTPDQIMRQIEAYASAGVEEFMLQWRDMDDINGLRNFAESVLHRL